MSLFLTIYELALAVMELDVVHVFLLFSFPLCSGGKIDMDMCDSVFILGSLCIF